MEEHKPKNLSLKELGKEYVAALGLAGISAMRQDLPAYVSDANVREAGADVYQRMEVDACISGNLKTLVAGDYVLTLGKTGYTSIGTANGAPASVKSRTNLKFIGELAPVAAAN